MRSSLPSRSRRSPDAAAIFLVAIPALAPILYLFLASFAKQWYWPALAPREWSGRAWSHVLEPSSGIFFSVGSSVTIAVAVTLLAILIALPAGRALALHQFRGKRMAIFILLLPVVAPPLASAMGVHALFLQYGLADTWLGVVLVHLVPAVPYATLMLMGSFSHFDIDSEAQARSLGASPLAAWRYVTLPAIAPGLAVAASFAFLISWSQYLTTLFIGGGRILTLPLILIEFQRGGDQAITAALSLIFLGPTFLLFLLVARYLKEAR